MKFHLGKSNMYDRHHQECLSVACVQFFAVIILSMPYLESMTLSCHCFRKHGLVRTSINVLEQML